MFWSNLFSGMRLHRVLLLSASILSAVVCIILERVHIFPLDVPTFFFFSFVLLLFSLYRPGWAFLLLIGALPLETISVAPSLFGGMMLRPYQWLACLLFLTVAIRLVARRLPFQLFRPRWFDALLPLLALGAFLALPNAPLFGIALKQALVVTSFVMLYFMGRIFFRTLYDVRQALPFFLGSSVVVFGFALWQNIAFLAGRESFEVMAGRPNATFTEADWLGLFALVVIAALSVLVDYFVISRMRLHNESSVLEGEKFLQIMIVCGTAVFLILAWSVLLITVARSAWLGGAVVVLVCAGALLFRQGFPSLTTSLPRTAFFVFIVSFSAGAALALTLLFHLTSFQLFNRAESTVSGLQKITVACASADTALPYKINDLSELTQNGCRHILLEEITAEQQAGHTIQEVHRDDPNVSVRQEIYGKVSQLIKAHPFLGIGWGSVSSFLGADERGAGLNASNMFLEVWLGSGLIGFLAFVFFWLYLAWSAFRWYVETVSSEERSFSLFLFVTWAGVTVFNLFNSGLLLGFFFIFLSLGALAMEHEELRLRTKKESL